MRKVSEFVCNISFSDGADGADGQGVDHVSFQSSSIGDEPALPGATDTYVVWGDAGETVNLGTFEVYNGTNAPAEGDVVFHKVLDIGPWDMGASNIVSIPHGLDMSKIVSVSAHVYNDDQDLLFPLEAGNTGPGSDPVGGWFLNATNLHLFRTDGEYFDSPDFNDLTINRGKVLIHYIP
jgi:hypothetical protein